jgi:hypothetical protein
MELKDIMPFEPEPTATLKGRYCKALFKWYDYRGGGLTLEEGPCANRDQVFDYFDGVRLMVSLDIEPEGERFLHLSASVPDYGSTLFKRIARGECSLDEFCMLVEEKWRTLSGDLRPFTRAREVFTARGVPHWRIKQ